MVQRITELMKQKQYSPLSVGEQATILFAADKGYMNDVPLERVGMFEQELNTYLHTDYKEFIENLTKTGALTDEVLETFKTLLKKIQS